MCLRSFEERKINEANFYSLWRLPDVGPWSSKYKINKLKRIIIK